MMKIERIAGDYLLGLSLLAYWIFLSLFWPSAPISDDYDLFLAPLLDTSWWSYLLSPHNEHLVSLPRVFSLYAIGLPNEESFRFLNGLFSAAILFCFFLCIRGLQRGAALPLLAIALTPVIGELYTFASAGACLGLGISFGILSLVLFFKKNNQFLAIICALASILCCSGGAIILPCIALALITPKIISRIETKIVLMMIFLPSLVFAITGNSELQNSLTFLKSPYVSFFQFFYALIGSALAFNHFLLSKLMGAGLLFLSYFTISYSLKKEQNYWVPAAVLFLLGLALAISYGRYEHGLVHSYFTSRYKIISLLLLIFNVRAILLYLPVAKYPIAILSCIYACLSYVYYLPELTHRKTIVEDSLVAYSLTGEGLLHPSSAYVQQLENTLSDKGIWSVPNVSPRTSPTTPVKTSFENSQRKLKGNIEARYLSDDILILHGWALPKEFSESVVTHWLLANSSRASLFLLREDHAYRVPIFRRFRPDLQNHFRNQGHTNAALFSGFSSLINVKSLAPGTYKVAIEMQEAKTRSTKIIGSISLK